MLWLPIEQTTQSSARSNFCAGEMELCTIALNQRLLNDRMLKKHSLLLYKRPTRHHNLDLTIEVKIMMIIKIFNLEPRDCVVVHSYPVKEFLLTGGT